MYDNIIKNLKNCFNNFCELADSVKLRKEIEINNTLPDDVKNSIFGDKNKDMKSMSELYGNALWYYIFQHYISLIELKLEEGTMDLTGPEELLGVMPKLLESLDNECRNIVNGDYSIDKDSKTVKTIHREAKKVPAEKIFDDSFNGNAKGIMLIPSPRALDKCANQVGKFISEQFKLWKNGDEFIEIIEKGSDKWHDFIEVGNKKSKRKYFLKHSIIDMILTMRHSYNSILYDKDKTFMKTDDNLTGVFTKYEIKEIIDKVEDLSERLEFFKNELEDDKALDYVYDGQWFTDEERYWYNKVDDILSQRDKLLN